MKRRINNVLTASNGQEGYDLYLKHKPDIILTDIKMPMMDGLEMSSLIRDEDAEVPIIVTTAHSETYLFQEAINIQINMFLIKPIDMTQLYNTIKITSENVLLKSKSKVNEQLVYSRTQELEKANSELEQKIFELQEIQHKLVSSENLAALGSLAAGIAHEINTPVGMGLTGITYLFEITKEIKEKYKTEDLSQKDFEDYITSCDEISTTINTNLTRTAQIVKNFKQVAIDQTSEIKRVFNVRKYIQGIILSLNNIIKKTNLFIDIQVDEDLVIEFYPGILAQIITNLIVNSTLHGFDKNESGTITISLAKNDNSLDFIYKDNGKGISKLNMPKIFDSFFTTKPEEGGSGLGLNIIKSMITISLNGTIKCESDENKGVVFTIELPLEV
jgi:signal transduction histidine kinase